MPLGTAVYGWPPGMSGCPSLGEDIAEDSSPVMQIRKYDKKEKPTSQHGIFEVKSIQKCGAPAAGNQKK